MSNRDIDELISQELVGKLLAWRHPGFSAHVGDAIAPEHRLQLETVAAYLVKSPLSLNKLVYLDSRQAALYRSNARAFGPNVGLCDQVNRLTYLRLSGSRG